MGPYSVKTGQTIYVNDSNLFLTPADGSKSAADNRRSQRDPDVLLRFFVDFVDPMFQVPPRMLETSDNIEALVIGYTGFFGGDLSVNSQSDQKPLRFGHGEGVPIFRDDNNPLGCSPYNQTYEDAAILIYRGKCSFLEKLVLARSADAAGILVISDEDFGINPTAEEKELVAAGDLSDIAIVVLTRRAGQVVIGMMDSTEEQGSGQVMLVLERSTVAHRGHMPGDKQEKVKDANRVLYLNGHPLLNTRLLV